ncbi:MAG: putative toxin-antitoxin system toxin component, PIN family [Bacteroidota bacterium]
MRIVLDTNVFLKSIPKNSRFRPIFDLIIQGQIQLLLTTDILLEYIEIIGNRSSTVVANNVGNLITKLPGTEKIQVHTKWRLIEADFDDNKFVDCAIAGNADFIVTDDKHFSVLKDISFPKVNVIGSSDYLVFLEKNNI